MIKRLKQRPMYQFLIMLTIASAVGLQGWRTLFNNFAVEVIGLDGFHIGIIQSVREIPGLLALCAIFFLFVLKEYHLSSLSIVILGVGVFLTGFFPSYTGLLCTTLLMSFGFHYYETTNRSLTLQYFDEHEAPMVFGMQRSLSAATNIAVGITVFIAYTLLSYKQIYALIGGGIVLVGMWALLQHPIDKETPVQHKHMILKRKYWLFYVLTVLAGARRQIFVVFSVFLLVKKFQFSVQDITILFVVNNIINYFLCPFIGKAINYFGERRILSLEYASLITVFIAYAYCDSKFVVAGLYILDHIFFNFAIAIGTYFQKIGEPKDIAPSMAVGFTINHIAAVVFPVVGGFLWVFNYRIPFLCGALLSVISLCMVQCIPKKRMA